MKVTVPGKTPMERLSNLTKRIIAVDKSEVVKLDKEWHSRKKRQKRR